MTALGSILAAAGLVPLLTLAGRRLRAAGLALFVAGSAVLALEVASTQIHHLRDSASRRPAEAAVAAVAALLLVVAAGVAGRRRPWLLAVAAVAAAPARIPIGVGSTSSNLLLPLYAVIAAAVVATALDLAADDDRRPDLGVIGWAIAGLVVWSALSCLWTIDVHKAGVEMLFFYLPFAFLLARLGALPNRVAGLRAAVAVQVALGVAFAAVALWQEATRHVFWNPAVIVGNEFSQFFRVNSLFWDASVFGRFLAVTVVLLAGICIHRGQRAWALALIGLFLVALYFSYSQSAELALATGAVVLGVAVWPRRVTVTIAAVASVAAVVALAVALHGANANRVSSDRLHLWRLGEKVVRAHPLAGAGIGSFGRAAVAGTAHPFAVTYAQSHTTPVTELAELGPLGLVLYLAVVIAPLVRAARSGTDPGPRMVLLALFALLIASSIFYNDFFEDPATWIVIALIVVVTREGDPARPAPAAAAGPAHQGIGTAT
ncbi:MAG TPA: O-antigen ligase family protein [Gaiellales bacterium]|nr:O-antigen ligase family protein [Gaiellales bacterium]